MYLIEMSHPVTFSRDGGPHSTEVAFALLPDGPGFESRTYLVCGHWTVEINRTHLVLTTDFANAVSVDV